MNHRCIACREASLERGATPAKCEGDSLSETHRRTCWGVGEQDDELISSDSGGEVGAPDGRSNRGCGELDEIIADAVAKGVIDRLQPIDIDH